MGIEFPDNMSITTSNEEENYFLGESQSVHSTEEMDIEAFLQQFKTRRKKSFSSKGKVMCKE